MSNPQFHNGKGHKPRMLTTTTKGSDMVAALVRDGISIPTLTKYFKPELQRGSAEANAKIGETLFKQAIGGNTAALIWWTKARMGWKAAKDEPESELPGPDPVERVERVIVQQSNP